MRSWLRYKVLQLKKGPADAGPFLAEMMMLFHGLAIGAHNLLRPEQVENRQVSAPNVYESCKGDDQKNDQSDEDVPLLPIRDEENLLPCFIIEGKEASDPLSEKDDCCTGAVRKIRIYDAANSENDNGQQEEQDPKIAWTRSRSHAFIG